MNQLATLVSILLGLALLAAVAFGGYYLFLQTYDLFRGLDYALTAILLVALIGTLMIAGAIRYAGRMLGVNQLRLEKKAELYARLMAASVRLLESDSDNEGQTGAELEAVALELACWGGSSVLKQFSALQSLDPQSPAMKTALESLLRAMRRDLGQSNLGLNQGDLLKLLYWGENRGTMRHD